MTRLKFKLGALVCLLIGGLWLSQVSSARADVSAQQPTGSIPTVTGSPSGPMASVNFEREIIYVWAGPGSDYPRIGILVAGQVVPALGRSQGDGLDFYVKIAYPGVTGGVGWVYAPLVSVNGSLPLVKPPPTPTPRVTPTIDPTLAAQFVIEFGPTQMPTFTQPAPLTIPTFAAGGSASAPTRVPMGFFIIGLAVIGLFGAVIAILRGR